MRAETRRLGGFWLTIVAEPAGVCLFPSRGRGEFERAKMRSPALEVSAQKGLVCSHRLSWPGPALGSLAPGGLALALWPSLKTAGPLVPESGR